MVYALALTAVLAAAAANEGAGEGQVKEVPVAVQVARECLTPELWGRTLDGIVVQYAAQFRAMAHQKGGDFDAGFEPAMRRLYDDLFPYGDVVDIQASLLQKHFTEAELLQLLDLYRSPLGVKMRDRMPELQQDALALAFQKIDSARVDEALRPHFHKHAKAKRGRSQ